MKENDQPSLDASTRAEYLFFEALAYEDENERISFVKNACERDAAMRQEVDHLFDTLAVADNFFGNHTPPEMPIKDLVDTLTNILENDSNVPSGPDMQPVSRT